MFKTRLAKENWASKYQYDNETPQETFRRAAKACASVELESEREKWEELFYNTLVDKETEQLKCTFGGRITANIGTDYKATTLLNCFINSAPKNAKIIYTREIPGTNLTIDNTLDTQGTPDSLANIMLAVLEQAETLKSEGGYGINFDFIRPRGSIIKGIGIEHPGVVKYMEIWDKVSDVIVSGNADGYKDLVENHKLDKKEIRGLKKMARKGAMMGCLSVSHPDIEEFVRAKQQPGKLTKFNISIVVDDKFMNAVVNDDFYDLVFDGEIYKTIKAKELYDLIMLSTYNRAEPGILYYDAMQFNNPLAFLGDINATNPCGEIGGNKHTSTVCLLGSLNLTAYIKIDRTFDWDQFGSDVRVFARMLDNINDLTGAALPQYEWAVKNVRQYGMGINGLGSALYMMGIRYGSKESIEFTEKVNALKEELCWETSAWLAEVKGAFPSYNEKFLETDWFTKFTKISEKTKDLIRKYGVRNGKTTTNPPLGNSSVICDMISNGIEPVFMHEYMRTIIEPNWPLGMDQTNVKEILKETKQGDAVVWQGEYNGQMYHYEPHNRGLCVIEAVRDYGYQWVLDNFPEDVKNSAEYLVTTEGLTVDEHVEVQAVVQANVNQSVSKTANLPNDYPFEDFKNLYITAWKKGLNGFTTYRDGSMEAVLSKIDKKEEQMEVEIIKRDIKLPDEFLNGPMKIIKREGRKFYINFSYLPEDSEMKHPVVIWINTNNEGGDLVAVKQACKKLVELMKNFEIDSELLDRQLEKIRGDQSYKQLGKMISMCLRHNLPVSSIVTSLENIEDDYISSLLTAVRKFLASKVKDGTKVIGKNCSACESSNIIFESGCSKCLDCGSSNCG
jgi:ribonucleoside-diphosphate reductase alpha chain